MSEPTLAAEPKFLDGNLVGWFVEAYFGDLKIPAQIDTGAWTSSIPVGLGTQLSCKEFGTEAVRGILGGDGHKLPVWEGDRLNGVMLHGAGYRAVVNFGRLRSNGLEHMILGCDFLSNFTSIVSSGAILLHINSTPGAAGKDLA